MWRNPFHVILTADGLDTPRKRSASRHAGWEYRVLPIEPPDRRDWPGRLERFFNALGGEGWELVAVDEQRAIFKRPISSRLPSTPGTPGHSSREAAPDWDARWPD